jgi:c-di-AMP phosphodiesterase-like protein
MEHGIIFWILIAIAVLIVSFLVTGFYIEITIILLILNLMILGISLNTSKIRKDEDKIAAKIENVEKLCSVILDSVTTGLLLANMKEEMKKQKETTDKVLNEISEKTRKLEESLNKFGKELAESLKNFESRIEHLETRKEKSI